MFISLEAGFNGDSLTVTNNAGIMVLGTGECLS